jgi:hypothetical protein
MEQGTPTKWEHSINILLLVTETNEILKIWMSDRLFPKYFSVYLSSQEALNSLWLLKHDLSSHIWMIITPATQYY